MLERVSTKVLATTCAFSVLPLSLAAGAYAQTASDEDSVVVKDATIQQGEKLDLLSLISNSKDPQLPGVLPVREVKYPSTLITTGVHIPELGPDTPKFKGDWENPPAGSWYNLWDSDYIRWTPDSGWYDANKHYREKPRPYGSGGTDGHSCWAASSANQLMWWIKQNRPWVDEYFRKYKDANQDLLPGHHITDSYNEQEYQPFLDYFVEHFRDVSGYQTGGNFWFITGEKTSELAAPFKSEQFGENFKGYFSKVFTPEIARKNGLTSYEKYPRSNAKRAFSNYVINALRNNRAVAFELKYSASYRHAVTIWGVEINKDGLVDYIYYSDSDSQNDPYQRVSLIHRIKLLDTDDGQMLFITGNYNQTKPDPRNPQLISVNSLGLGREVWLDWYRKFANNFKVQNDGGFNADVPGVYKITFEDGDKHVISKQATVTVLAKQPTVQPDQGAKEETEASESKPESTQTTPPAAGSAEQAAPETQPADETAKENDVPNHAEKQPAEENEKQPEESKQPGTAAGSEQASPAETVPSVPAPSVETCKAKGEVLVEGTCQPCGPGLQPNNEYNGCVAQEIVPAPTPEKAPEESTPAGNSEENTPVAPGETVTTTQPEKTEDNTAPSSEPGESTEKAEGEQTGENQGSTVGEESQPEVPLVTPSTEEKQQPAATPEEKQEESNESAPSDSKPEDTEAPQDQAGNDKVETPLVPSEDQTTAPETGANEAGTPENTTPGSDNENSEQQPPAASEEEQQDNGSSAEQDQSTGEENTPGTAEDSNVNEEQGKDSPETGTTEGQKEETSQPEANPAVEPGVQENTPSAGDTAASEGEKTEPKEPEVPLVTPEKQQEETSKPATGESAPAKEEEQPAAGQGEQGSANSSTSSEKEEAKEPASNAEQPAAENPPAAQDNDTSKQPSESQPAEGEEKQEAASGGKQEESAEKSPEVVVPDAKQAAEKAKFSYADGGVTLQAVAGDKVAVYLNGWPAGAKVDFYLHSTPVFLGSAQVNAEGILTRELNIPANTEPGSHQVVAKSGEIVKQIEVTVLPAPKEEVSGQGLATEKQPELKPQTGSRERLSNTGSLSGLFGLGALALLVAGGVLVSVRRRA